MNVQKLGQILNEMYNKAPNGDRVTNIHLFGIKFAEIILKNHFSVKSIVECSGINVSYAAEVSKGVRLARYVTPKE
ncbi:HTH-like domain-containing protein [Cohnella cellulosilytica]